MRWSGRDWATGMVAVTVAIAVYLYAVPSGRELRSDYYGLRSDMPRVEAEELLGGSGEVLPPKYFYCVVCLSGSSEAEKEARARQVEAAHTESRRYSRPMYTIDIEYEGYRAPRLKSAIFTPAWSWALVAYLSAILLLLATTAELSRLVCLKGGWLPTSRQASGA